MVLVWHWSLVVIGLGCLGFVLVFSAFGWFCVLLPLFLGCCWWSGECVLGCVGRVWVFVGLSSVVFCGWFDHLAVRCLVADCSGLSVDDWDSFPMIQSSQCRSCLNIHNCFMLLIDRKLIARCCSKSDLLLLENLYDDVVLLAAP